jgi:DNA-binding response OmpR family regulator
MSKKTILIVDDDPDQLQGLSIRLKASGYKVAVASDCVQTIGTVRRLHPDLILLDIGLPAGDGYLVMERLRAFQLLSTIPVIVISAKDEAVHRQKALNAGAVAYFQKPADNDELGAAVRAALGE